jgi:hypothetical protein
MTIEPATDEVSRWLTLERVGLSQLVEWSMFDNRDYWASSSVDQEAWLYGLIRGFMVGGCYDLANAVALETASSMAIFRRRGDAILGRIAHAVVYIPEDGAGADILGIRPISGIVAELSDAVGAVSTSVEAGENWPEDDPADHERLAKIAAGVPWLPKSPRREATPFGEFVRLTSLAQVQ